MTEKKNKKKKPFANSVTKIKRLLRHLPHVPGYTPAPSPSEPDLPFPRCFTTQQINTTEFLIPEKWLIRIFSLLFLPAIIFSS